MVKKYQKITKKELELISPKFSKYGLDFNDSRFVSQKEICCIFRKSRRVWQDFLKDKQVREILQISDHLDCHAQICSKNGGRIIKLFEFNSVLDALKFEICQGFRPKMAKCSNRRYVKYYDQIHGKQSFIDLFNTWLKERKIPDCVKSDYISYKEMSKLFSKKNIFLTEFGKRLIVNDCMNLEKESSESHITLTTIHDSIKHLQKQLENLSQKTMHLSDKDVYDKNYSWVYSNGKVMDSGSLKRFDHSNRDMLVFDIEGKEVSCLKDHFCNRNQEDVSLAQKNFLA